MAAFLDKLVGWLWGTPLIVTIIGTGLYLTLRAGFFQFRYFGHIMKQTFGKLLGKTGDDSEGILSPMEVISTSIGSSVGVGNIGGVATAIAVGGPGAVFWMWISALLGLLLKQVEVTLAVYYRCKDEKGNPYGGPTYYMEKGLGEEKGWKAWSILAILFGIGIFTTAFIDLQSYTVSEAIQSAFNIPMLATGVVYLILVYFMIWGGIPSLGKKASLIVPFMCIFYIVGGLIIIIKNAGHLGEAFGLIFTSAFNGTAAVGGFTGAAFAQVIRMGVARSVFSNEAGWGTSPMIHSTAKTEHPVKQGLWGSFEVFVDTMIVCTITALVIITTGAWSSGVSGATLTLNAFEIGIGSAGRAVIAVGIFFFGLTTSTGWYAYYEILLRHLFKNNVKFKNKVLTFFKWFYPIPGFCMVIIALTSGLPGASIWYFADITTAIPTFTNVFAVLVLSGKYFELLKDYKARYLNMGTVDPNFSPFYEDKVAAKCEKNGFK